MHALRAVSAFALLFVVPLCKGASEEQAIVRYPLVIDPIVQLAELTASDGKQSDDLGWSVGSSGNTIVAVGDGGTSAHVFVKSATGWANMTQTAELSPSDGVTFGNSVAISGDTIVVGAHVATVGQGKVYVYVKPAAGWTNMTETAQLTASDGAAGDSLGYSVAIDGSTVVAGAWLENNNDGAVYLFNEPNGGWISMTQTAKLTASDENSGGFLGYSVALEGNTVVGGAIFSGIGGAAYIFIKPSTGWADATENAKLTSSDAHFLDSFGQSVSISGSTIVVGAPEPSNPHRHGAAYVFVEPASGWATTMETAELRASDGAVGDYFGDAVSVSGNRVAVGASQATIGGNNFQGAVYVYTKPATGWRNSSQFIQKLTAGESPTQVGTSVVISGSDLVTGAYGVGGNIGAVFVFGP
jgi:hypothetical protein